MPSGETVNVVTIWAIVVALVIGGIIDVWMSIYGGPGATISETMWGLSQRYPMIPFLIGTLVGHLLWPQKGR